jgi:hypothetical protein
MAITLRSEVKKRLEIAVLISDYQKKVKELDVMIRNVMWSEPDDTEKNPGSGRNHFHGRSHTDMDGI